MGTVGAMARPVIGICTALERARATHADELMRPLADALTAYHQRGVRVALCAGSASRADRLAARAMGKDMIHPADQHDEEQEGQPERQNGIELALRPHLRGILIDLVISDDHHDRQEDAQR